MASVIVLICSVSSSIKLLIFPLFIVKGTISGDISNDILVCTCNDFLELRRRDTCNDPTFSCISNHKNDTSLSILLSILPNHE